MTNLRLLLLLSAAIPALSGAEAPAAGGAPVRVRAAALDVPEGGRLVPASLHAARRATISTRMAATVRGVHVREGERVRAGQLLVSLAGDDVRGGLAAAEAGLAAASAHERRIQALLEQGAATPSEREMATADRARAAAAVAAARANLSHTEIRAPFAAAVQARRVEPGDLVGPGLPLLELQGDELELVASLTETEAAGIAVGQKLPFASGRVRGTAVVTALAPGGDPLTHRRGLRARVDGAAAELRAGAFARLSVPAGGPEPARGLWVPRTALVERGDLTGVFVAEGGRAELRWLSLGESAADHVSVRAGLKPDEIVVDAPGALRDGDRVEVVR
jgi:RND family efflux transporter MFP subunit